MHAFSVILNVETMHFGMQQMLYQSVLVILLLMFDTIIGISIIHALLSISNFDTC